ncbi:MAG TPA: efflux RND transporter periplasmic adaptor subunit [Syntrophales bacterium]|nr:efflux RND transporter periplasmic adaptor subunit [Syntrophales bacterium]
MALKKWWGFFLILTLAGGVYGCSAQGSDDRSGKNDPTRPLIAVEVLKVTPADLMEVIDVVGSLSPKFQTDVKSEMTGIVREILVTEWVPVRKGAILARLDAREEDVVLQKAEADRAAARANLLQAEASGRRADREYRRALNLKEAGLMTQQNLDDALTAKEAAEAVIASAKAQANAAEKGVRHAGTRLSKLVIVAPIDGVVAYRDVNVGDLVGEMGAQKPLFRIVDNRILDLTVTVASRSLERIKVGMPVTFTTDAFPGKMFSGEVAFINPVVNDADRTIQVRIEIPNKDQVLKGGLFVKGQIISGTRRGVLQVPRSALVNWDRLKSTGKILVVEKETARLASVQTGAAVDELVEIVSGLQAGETVITRGGFNVRQGDRVKIIQKS